MNTNSLKTNFLEAVKKLDLRFPIAEISDKTGYKPGTVSEYLKGVSSISERFIRKVCDAYNISFDDLRLPATKSTQVGSHEFTKMNYTSEDKLKAIDAYLNEADYEREYGKQYREFKEKVQLADLPMIIFDHEIRIKNLEQRLN